MPQAVFQTPLVEKTIKAQNKVLAGETAIRWFAINVLLCLFCTAHAGMFLVSYLVTLPLQYSTWGTYFEVSLAAVFGISALCDLVTYAKSRQFERDLAALSPAQSLLMNVKSSAKIVVQAPDTPTTPRSKSLLRAPSTPLTPTTPVTPHMRRRISEPCHPYTPPISTSLSNSFHSVASTTLNTSNISFTTPLRESESSFSTFTPSPNVRKSVSNINTLETYLKEYEDKEKWLSRGQTERNSGGWAPRATDSLPPRPYYLAMQNQNISVAGDTSYYSPQAAEALIERLGITRHSIDVWTENCRKWLAQTIFHHLVSEIKTINLMLEQHGSPEYKVGSVSTAVLSKLSANKQEHMPNIALLLPYLEVSVNQEYLVNRIKELGEGSCLGCFRWESGGRYKNAVWNKDLPTDGQIVSHCVCTYLDSHLPRNPMYPEGRTFSTQYFVQTPSKADTKKKDFAVYQSSIHPPHYKLLISDEVWEVEKGRNNLFYSLILLLFYVKEEQHGMLGPIHLGPTGLNMLWIIE